MVKNAHLKRSKKSRIRKPLKKRKSAVRGPRRVFATHPPSPRRRRRIPPGRARKLQLALMLKISRPTLDVYLTMPGSPIPDKRRTYEIAAVESFIAANAKTSATNDAGKTYRTEKTKMEAENLKFDLDVKRGEYFQRSVAIPVFANMTSELVANLRQKYELELPSRCVGKSLVEITQINIEAIDWIIKRFKAGARPLTA